MSVRRRLLPVALAALAAVMVSAAPAAAAPDNAGTDFWVGFMNNAASAIELKLFITGDQATTGTAEVPGRAFSQPFTVTPGTVTTVDLPADAAMPLGESKQDVGVHVTAASEVAVYGLSRIQATTDGFLGLPVDVLASEYTVMTWGPGAIGGSELAIVATANGTTATITPKVATQGGHAAGTPYDVTLDAGEVYQVQAATPGDDLTGTTIASTADVALFGGHVCAQIPNTGTDACDHVVEQITPVETWGTSFLTVPLKTRLNGDTFKFLASEDATEVKVNGTAVVTLDAGQQHQQIIDGQATITSNNPILVSQFSNGSTFDNVTSDPFMMLIPPFEQFQAGYTVTTPATGFAQNFVNLVVPDAAVGSVKVDGTAVPAAEYTPIGSSGFQGAQVDLSLGSHTLTGDGQPFGAFLYGFDFFDSYGYAGGLSLAPIARVSKVELSPATATHDVTTRQCVTATVTDASNARVPGVRVDFVATGANAATDSVNADGQGQSEFCYTGTKTGTDTITGSVGAVSGTAAKTWVYPGHPGPPPPAPPPAPAPPPGPCVKETAKLEVARVTMLRTERVLDLLAPITRKASGTARLNLHAARQRVPMTAPIDSANARIRVRRDIPRAQAQLGTGILSIRYLGDADTRPQDVRLRAASQHANLNAKRPTISGGRLRTSGTLSRKVRNRVVRVQLEFDNAACKTTTLEFKAPVVNGRWSLNQQLSAGVRNTIANRRGTVQSYILFTGYLPRRIRGEMQSVGVLGDR